jgi:diguanylate cyclase (GGDEF)-like protein
MIMVRKRSQLEPTGGVVLLVDDDLDYLAIHRRLLEREGHEVVCAKSGSEALAIAQDRHVDLMLLDYFMPGMTGEEVVEELRKNNSKIQVVLQTGYASENPPRDLLKRLDIQGYYDKSEGPDKFLLWADVGLKTAYSVQMIEKSKRGLQYILDTTPDLHKIQPLDDLLLGILWQVAGLLGAVNSFLAVFADGALSHPEPLETEGFIAIHNDSDLVIRASTGQYQVSDHLKAVLDEEINNKINDVLQKGSIDIINFSIIVPLKVGESILGVLYLDRPPLDEDGIDLIQIFANQAAVAIQNVQLYEMAAIDSLTSVYVRGFFDQVALRELRTTFRSQYEASIMMVDVDNLKKINDTEGHIRGDEALESIGNILRKTIRGDDIVGRYGGDEFALILPKTNLAGAILVGERIIEQLEENSLDGTNGEIALEISIGICTLEEHNFSNEELVRPVTTEYFMEMYKYILKETDQALYQAKHNGGNQIFAGKMLAWKS